MGFLALHQDVLISSLSGVKKFRKVWYFTKKIEKAAILTDLSFQIRRMAAQAMTLASSILRRFVSMDGCVYI